MKENKQTLLIIEAYDRGYRVTLDGSVRGVRVAELSLSKNSKGYLSFNMRFDDKVTRIFIHRLQAFQKYGNKIFEEGILVRHLDGDSENNSRDNILIGSASDNMMDIPKKDRIKKSLYATSFVRKYDQKSVKEFHKINRSYRKTMEKFNISSKGTLNYILNN